MSKTPDRTIKRYAGQRLYDAGASRYVDVADIARAVQAGEDIRVLDAKTGQDVTEAVVAGMDRTRH